MMGHNSSSFGKDERVVNAEFDRSRNLSCCFHLRALPTMGKSKSKGLKRYDPPTDEFYIEVANPIGIDQGISSPEFHKRLGIWLECASGIKPYAFWYFGTMSSVIVAFVGHQFTDELKSKLLGEHVIGEHLSAVFEYNYRNFGDPERVLRAWPSVCMHISFTLFLDCKKGSYDVIPRQVYKVPLPTNYSKSMIFDRRFAIVPTTPLYPDRLPTESLPTPTSSETSSPPPPPPWMSLSTSTTLRPLGRPPPEAHTNASASSSGHTKTELVDGKLPGRSSLGKRKRAEGALEASGGEFSPICMKPALTLIRTSKGRAHRLPTSARTTSSQEACPTQSRRVPSEACRQEARGLGCSHPGSRLPTQTGRQLQSQNRGCTRNDTVTPAPASPPTNAGQ